MLTNSSPQANIVPSLGVVHEYSADGSYDFTGHIEAQLAFLEQISPLAAAPLQARFQNVLDGRYFGSDHIRKVEKDVINALDKFAPAGLYYGYARYNSNIAGFWPKEWQKPMGGAPIDSEVRKLGQCVVTPIA